MKNETTPVKPFHHNRLPFMPYPQRKPKYLAAIRFLTTNNEVYNGHYMNVLPDSYISMSTTSNFAFVTGKDENALAIDHNEIKGWWYINEKK